MLENISPKLANNFYCENCNYNCSKQSDYKKHTMTRKHQFSTNINNSPTEKVADKYDCKCGKSYKDRTGGMRQMHNYVDLNYADQISTPVDEAEYKKVARLPEGLTVEQLQEQRNSDLTKITGVRRPPI